MSKAFEINGLVKEFPEFKLGPLNLDLEPGTVLGYVGPNGSGKSTTMHCMVGLVEKDEGDIRIFGRENDPNNVDWKLDIGYVGDAHVFYENWSGRKNLDFLKQFYPDWDSNMELDLIKRFEIPINKPAKDLSSGNRVKLSLIGALAHNPKLLILDEPTSGLDPLVRSELLDLLFEVVEMGERSIFYSTHNLADISEIADELAFINDGMIVTRSVKEDLVNDWRKISFRSERDLNSFSGIVSLRKERSSYQVITKNRSATLGYLKEAGVENIEEARMSINDIAVQILKESKNV